jgi:tape measure domain-containing protein
MGQETIDIVVKEGGSDKAAANIRSIGTAADTTSASVDKLNTTMTTASGGAAKMQQAAQGVAASAESEAAAHGKAAAAVVNHAHGLEQGAQAAEQLRGVLISLGLALGVEQWVRLTDAYTTNINQLRQVTKSAEEYAMVQARLKTLSDETFSSLDSNTRLFVSLSQASRDLRLSQDQLFNVVHVLNDSLRQSGSNSAAAAGSIQALSVALQTGTLTARNILPLLHEMPSLVQALADKFNFAGPQATGNFVKALENGTITVRQVVTAIAGLDNTLQGGVRNLQQSAQAYDKHGQAVYSDYEKTLIAKGELLDYSQVQKDAEKDVLDYSNTTKKATAAIAESGVVMNKVAAGFTNVLPTIGDGWTRVKNAIYEYVGAQDTATGASAKATQALIFIADNAHVVFGAVTILSAALVAYTAAANAARIVTLLFGASFSWAGLAVAGIAAAAAAILAFGNDIKLTADGSITAMGAVVAVIHIARDGLVDLWRVVGQGTGAWGQAALAAVGFAVALRIVTGIDAIKWVLELTVKLASLAVAAVAAAGPWGVLAAAVVTAGVAAAYFSGKLDGLIDSIKSTLGPAIDFVKGKATEMTQEFTKSTAAVDEFGKKNNEVWPDIIRGVGQAQGAILNMTDYTNAGLGKMAAVMDNTTSTMNTDFSSIASGANSASASLTNLMNAQNSVNTAASNFHLQPGQSAYGGSTKGGIVWNNSGILTSHDLNPGSHFASGGSFMVGGQGGTDSQVVKFMASPDERVTVETPAQQQAKSKQGGSVVTVPISMTVVAKDAASFNSNRQQIVMGLSSELSRALRNIGNGS